MKAENLTKKDLINKSKKLLKNLSARFKNIERLQLAVAQKTVKDFKRIQNNLPKKLNNLSEKEARNLYRDLTYISNLKTSTVKGAKQAEQNFGEIKNILNTFSKKTQENFWEAYSQLYEHNALFEHFKYNIFDTIIDEMSQGQQTDSIVNNIISLYRETLEESGNNATMQDITILFTDKIKNFSK